MFTQPMNFGTPVQERSQGDLIPKDTLLWVRADVRGIKNSKQTNGRFVDIELTIAENQTFAGRKLWDTIMDPYDNLNSVEARDMGTGKIRRILEGVFGARPDNPNSYQLPSYEALGGQHLIPVCVGIQKAKADSGYDDKNTVEYLSPHSSVKKVVECYNLLKNGVNKWEKAGGAKPAAAPAQQGFSMPPQAQPQQGGFTPPAAAPAPAQQNAPGWLGQPPGAAPAATSGLAVQTPPAATPAPQGGQQFPQSHTAPAAAGAPMAAPGAAPVNQQMQPQGFQQPQGQGFAANAGQLQPPAATNTAPAATPATPSPSNGWAPPAGNPAQLPGQGQ